MAETIMAGRRRADQRPSLISRTTNGAPQRRAETNRPTAVPMPLPLFLSPFLLGGTAVLLTVVLVVLTR